MKTLMKVCCKFSVYTKLLQLIQHFILGHIEEMYKDYAGTEINVNDVLDSEV